MKIKISFLVISMTLFISIGCGKKDHGEPAVEEPKYCWMLIDQAGNLMGRICDRTEKQMSDSVPSCNYYKLGGEELCWLIDGTNYIEKKPEEYVKLVIKCFGQKNSYKKVDCGYCQVWYTRQKSIYKPDNTATYSKVKVERLCGDTVKTLYNRRNVTIRETTDSLIVIEFGNSPTF
ncbi:hypothetical protein [Niastella sp. OAS944]|jgi:hypothetical protein|uniref:hypothetical protein n=1 Tax=Niastella sp. OAS944 TaxID=2664089 RepID=UPI00349157BF|nr:hypothetical protein [Chitinophagaceae bacterium OAS944]